MTKLLEILPFALSLLVKLLSITVLPKIMLTSLEDLASLPGSASSNIKFGNDQRRLIVNTVANSALKATATLTSVASAFNAFVIVYLKPSSVRMISLSLAIAILVLLLAWMLPQSPQQLSEKHPFGVERATFITVLFCFFDGFGVVLSLLG